MSQTALILVSLLLAPVPAHRPPARERVEWIELSGEEGVGRLATTPEFMQGDQAVYHFGAGPCRARRLDKRTLDELLAAMRSGALVKIEAKTVGAGDGARSCVEAVRLFAPPR